MDELAAARAFQLQLANHIYLCYEILSRLAERKKKRSDDMDLPERLEAAAERMPLLVVTANLLRTAAAVIRVKDNRIAGLEAEIERMLRIQSSLDDEIEQLEIILSNAKEPHHDEQR